MIEARCVQSVVSMGNKMSIIYAGDLTRSEVYDVFSRKFSMFNNNHLKFNLTMLNTKYYASTKRMLYYLLKVT